jgi:hypothetical protein
MLRFFNSIKVIQPLNLFSVNSFASTLGVEVLIL